jgi:two-component system probable response regulator PhcQ
MDVHVQTDPRVLLVDDEPAVAQALRRCLRQALDHHTAIEICHSGAAALERLHAQAFDAIVSDLRMPGMDGLQLLQHARGIQPLCTRLILTATADFASAQRAVNSFGIYRYLTKPWDPAALAADVRDAIEHGRALRQQQAQATAWTVAQGQTSPEALERLRLEALEPGITHVEWAADGSVLMPPLDG